MVINKQKPPFFDRYVPLLFCMVICGFYLVTAYEYFSRLQSLSVDYSVVSTTIKVLICVMTLPVMLRLIVRNTVMLFVLLIYIAVFIMLTTLLFPENRTFIQRYQLDLLMSLLMILYVSSIRYFDYLLELMTFYFYFVCVCQILMIVIIFLFRKIPRYSMGFGYAGVLPTMVTLNAFAKEKKIGYLLLAIGSAITILLCGSRGAILCIGVFVLAKFFRPSRKNFALYILLLSVCLLVFLNLSAISNFLHGTLQRFGLNSRTITLFQRDLGDKTLYLTSRDIGYQNALDEIARNPFQYRGAFSSFVLHGHYIHNLVLDILLDYGVALGVVILCGLLYMSVRSIFQTRDSLGDLALIFFCYSIPSLMVSSTYLLEWNFGVWLVFSAKMIYRHRRQASMSYRYRQKRSMRHSRTILSHEKP